MRDQVPKSDVDPYRGVVLLLAGIALAGAVAAAYGGAALRQPQLLAVALLLGVASFVLVGVAAAAHARSRTTSPAADEPVTGEAENGPRPDESVELPAAPPEPGARETSEAEDASATEPRRPPGVVSSRRARAIARWIRGLGVVETIRWIAGLAAAVGVVPLVFAAPPAPLPVSIGGVVGALCLAAAALAAIATRYFASLSESALPEALGLARGARLVAWGLVLAALGTLSAAFAQETAARLVHFAILGLVASISWSLLKVRPRAKRAAAEFPVDSPILSALGSRANPIGSLLDSAERQLGIDLRSTWALSVVRRSVEPLLAGLLVLGWLSSSLTVVHLGEQGLVERLGVPIGGPPLEPGLHGHWPWPVDRVFRLPVRRIQALEIGHEGKEAPGPEDVLWARQHAENEYTLLLGNGRDLITIDAVVQFRVRDARAWQYRVRNPTDALRAVAYRAVMRATVNRTLDEALSENVSLLTGRMLAAVQRDADDLGLGVEVVAFTVGGMHPPVTVAAEYQSVSSAELGKVTAEVNAEAYRNRTVPAAQAEVVQRLDTAQADAAELRARAAGEAWSFRTLESQFRADPREFTFRRRLETLEQGLANRRLIVLDTRIPRDGGELWLTP